MAVKTGQCMCGAVKFTLRDVKTEFGGCHCKMCQRWTGSAMLTVIAPEDKITIEGAENVKTFKSSDWAERSWCDKCGSGLWYRVTSPGPYSGFYHLPVGLLDDPSGMTLVSEIFVDVKSPAFSYAQDTKKMTGAEVMAQFAPPEGD